MPPKDAILVEAQFSRFFHVRSQTLTEGEHSRRHQGYPRVFTKISRRSRSAIRSVRGETCRILSSRNNRSIVTPTSVTARGGKAVTVSPPRCVSAITRGVRAISITETNITNARQARHVNGIELISKLLSYVLVHKYKRSVQVAILPFFLPPSLSLSLSLSRARARNARKTRRVPFRVMRLRQNNVPGYQSPGRPLSVVHMTFSAIAIGAVVIALQSYFTRAVRYCPKVRNIIIFFVLATARSAISFATFPSVFPNPRPVERGSSKIRPLRNSRLLARARANHRVRQVRVVGVHGNAP